MRWSKVPSTGSALSARLKKREVPRPHPASGKGEETHLVGLIDTGTHTVLDHLLHQQGVGLVTDLTKQKREAGLGLRGATRGGALADPRLVNLGTHHLHLLFTWNSPANRTRFGNASLATRVVTK